ncbi:GNAT family N-acetyltransferase [Acerihabitans arboris]|uniref:GNAT family N-acetyltransferase n=1 Tax=Acerihabitans arboris TaxID=2691583 RepID=A0A845SJH8_9GAMM|nr:GNAT family N-acetyltransferase [Acerihabitans arboris]NDL61485.1 GNAT family N-acetyltransferase [Acerihabitans arboris]
MSAGYRQLTVADAEPFLALMHAAYAPIRELGIHFDAATADPARVGRHLDEHGVYGMFLDGKLVASATLRYPWGPLPGPFGLPHIGWFGADPGYRGRHLGSQMLQWLEQAILLDQLRAPAVSLGTAENHPWLAEMYQARGFLPMHKADLGKGHITIYMKKILDETRHALWLQRTAAQEAAQ